MDFSSFSYFNPRLREGGDNSTRLSINSCFVFQSTPPRRRRLFHLVNLLLYKEISIHASEKEATTAYDIHTQLFSFQSTPPRRRRQKCFKHFLKQYLFQSTPPRRRRQYFIIASFSSFGFQSTPPRRRRLILFMVFILHTIFQSTPPRRRRRNLLF